MPLPSGTVTFLFTDIEGSTQLWEQHQRAMELALAQHHTLLREAIEAQGGQVFQIIGDAFCAAFPTAPAALHAALLAQHALRDAAWGPTGPIRVRMALHTATVALQAGDYPSGPHFNRLARLLNAGHGGQVLISLPTVALLRDYLLYAVELRALGTYRLRGLSLPEQIFQLVTPDLPDDFPPLKTLDQPNTNLPAQATAFIGREKEVGALRELLGRDDVRLVTLTGPGGTGKTRLSLQVAADALDLFEHGVWFVNLAPLSDPGLVASAIAHALGVREVAQQPIVDSLKRYLREKRMLLLLDNFEQVLDAAPLVAELLTAAPGLKVLVTSRATLHLYGEHEFAVPPLALPERGKLPPLERLTQYEAVRLFIDRAQAAKSDFAITNANAPAVADICERLDGLPLAIELAAARSKLFAPQALLARLRNRLELLTGGARDLPARQQTLRNTIAWSYDLLSAQEQALFRRLGVFVGGCTLEAAEALTSSNVGTLERSNVLEGLAALIEQSLLRREDGVDGELRFVMLETVREYALERLEESDETDEMRRRHAEHFLTLAETELIGPAQQMWLIRLKADYDNLHAAMVWSLRGQAEPSTASWQALELELRLAWALWIFWTMHNRQSEGRAWIEGGLERSRNTAIVLPRSVRMKALNVAGYMVVAQGDHIRATALLEELLALSRDMGDHLGIASALVHLGRMSRYQGDYGRAERLEEESLTLFRSQGDTWGTTQALVSLSDAALEQGALDRATSYLQEALAICQDFGLVEWTIWATYNLGRVAHLRSDYPQALSQLKESLAQFRDLDYTIGVGETLIVLGRVALAQGDSSWAAQHFAGGLALLRETPVREIHDAAIEGLAGVAAAQGQPERAARLFGAAEAQREAHGEPLPPAYRAGYEHDVATARAQLDAATFAAAWAAGRAMTLEQAIAYALNEDDESAESRQTYHPFKATETP